jgi:transposase InsO family protein
MIGTIRRECLDWLIPVSEAHLRAILKDWTAYYNGSPPHMALGPGVPDPPATPMLASKKNSRHRLGERLVVRARSVLGGLRHEYSLIETAG